MMNNNKKYYVVFGYAKPLKIEITEGNFNVIIDSPNDIHRVSPIEDPSRYFYVPQASINYYYVDEQN